MTRSNRSSSARESLSRKAASRCGEHEHSAAGSPRPAQGQRFIVATSWNRAGKSAWPCARATATTPSSSGCRNASSAGRWNSGSSSRRRTPRWARLASPGSGTGAAADDRGRGGAVVRRAKGTARDQRPLGRQHARNGVDAHHLERLPRLERRQDRRQPAPEHRLPGSRRPGEQQVVTARCRELERAPRPLLAAHVRQVGWIGLLAPRRAARPAAGAARRAGTRPPRPDAAPRPPRRRRARPRRRTRERRGSARAPRGGRPRRPRTPRAPAARGRRARARRPPRAPRAAPPGSAARPRARRARSRGRSPSPPCAAPRARG